MKKLSSVMLALVLFAALCACGQKEAGGSSSSAEPTPTFPAEAYAGLFSDENFDTVLFTPNEDGGVAVEVGIYRLAQFDGTANYVDGAMELELLDPNGNPMYTTFFPAEDGTFTLKFTESNWSLLETDTAFAGFLPSESTGADDTYVGSFADLGGDEGCNIILFTPAEDGSYAVEISMFRLAQFDGTANYVDGAMELDLLDPNGNPLYGTFAPAEDGTYTLTFTESEWPLMESGTSFEGFLAYGSGDLIE